MDGLSALAAAVLGAVFLWSGVLKVAYPRRWLVALRHHGLPRPIRAAALPGVPWGELGVVALLAGGWHRAGGALALLLLTVFSIALVRLRVLMGQAPIDCGCFGETTPRDVHVLLARNAALALAACVVVTQPIDAGGGRAAALVTWTVAAAAWVLWQAAVRVGNARQTA